MRICSFEECERKLYARGICRGHYDQWYTGLTLAPISNPLPAGTRYLSYVDKRGDDECWPWKGGVDADGYGRFSLNGRYNRAHRLMLEFETGRKGQCALHSCDNPPCVNPRHLRWGTHADNVADRVAKGRDYKGSRSGGYRHPASVVNVARILLSRGIRKATVGRYLGISKSSVDKIATVAADD